MTDQSSNDREAQFLEARALRLQKSNDQRSTSIFATNGSSSAQKREELNFFWSKFRQAIGQWQNRLLQLREEATASVKSEPDPPNDNHDIIPTKNQKDSSKENSGMTNGCQVRHQPNQSKSEQRIYLRTALADLQADLDALRKHCLSSSSCTSSTDNVTTTLSSLEAEWEIPSDLIVAQTDLRLIHTELTKCATQLEQVKKDILPKAKFVFRRYRQARIKQQQQQHQALAVEAETQTLFQPKEMGVPNGQDTHPSLETAKVSKGPLEDHSHCSIQVSPEGDVSIVPISPSSSTVAASNKKENQKSAQDNALPSIPHDSHVSYPLSVSGQSSLVIRNVYDCSLSLANNVKELHISNVSNTVIDTTVSNPNPMEAHSNNNNRSNSIMGALHITNCQTVTLMVKSFHQLRIHDSSDLRICIEHAKESGGIILENCTNLVFVVKAPPSSPSDRNSITCLSLEDEAYQLLDVKDFNWLRHGVPSPNFRVEVDRHDDTTSQQKDPASKNTSSNIMESPITIAHQTSEPPIESIPVSGASSEMAASPDNDDSDDEL